MDLCWYIDNEGKCQNQVLGYLWQCYLKRGNIENRLKYNVTSKIAVSPINSRIKCFRSLFSQEKFKFSQPGSSTWLTLLFMDSEVQGLHTKQHGLKITRTEFFSLKSTIYSIIWGCFRVGKIFTEFSSITVVLVRSVIKFLDRNFLFIEKV